MVDDGGYSTFRTRSTKDPLASAPMWEGFMERDAPKMDAKPPPLPPPSKAMFIPKMESSISLIPTSELNHLYREYSLNSQEFKNNVTFSLRLEFLGKRVYGSHTHDGFKDDRRDLQQRLSTTQVPLFDGRNKMTIRAWLQKLHTYFTLNPMIEEDFVRSPTLQLDGIVYEWWQHGMTTQGHGAITSFDVFRCRMMDWFDKKDEDDYFKDFTTVRQRGSV